MSLDEMNWSSSVISLFLKYAQTIAFESSSHQKLFDDNFDCLQNAPNNEVLQ